MSVPPSAGERPAERAGGGPPRPLSPPDPTVIWHDLECGSYRADLPLWRELAASCPAGAILDIGAGAGRVALELARAQRRVIALDRDPALLAALRQRAGELDIETVCADARSFELPRHEPIGLCLAPMQTVQLLGGPEGRLAFLRRACAHLRPGALLACALVTELEPFDCAAGGPGPSAETTRFGATLYTSQATRVEIDEQTIAIERERRMTAPAGGEAMPPTRLSGTRAAVAVERNLIELDRVTVGQLEREGAFLGLRPEPARHIPPTEDHAGSAVVMLRA